MQTATATTGATDMPLWPRRHQPPPAAIPIDPHRPAAKAETRKVIERVNEWAQNLTAAVERVERVAPILLPDEDPKGGDRA